MKQFHVLKFLIQHRPRVTELELARAIYGDEGQPQQVSEDCRALVACGNVYRIGRGEADDPYRYWPEPASVRMPRYSRKKRVRRRKRARRRAAVITKGEESIG